MTPSGEIVWEYDLGTNVFRVEQFGADYPGFIGTGLEPECLHHGDGNLDGAITAVDAQAAFFIVLGSLTPLFEEACAADCDGNDSITAGDAQSIFNAVLGTSTCVDPV